METVAASAALPACTMMLPNFLSSDEGKSSRPAGSQGLAALQILVISQPCPPGFG